MEETLGRSPDAVFWLPESQMMCASQIGLPPVSIATTATGEFPIDLEDFAEVISESLSAEKLNVNLKAFKMGDPICTGC